MEPVDPEPPDESGDEEETSPAEEWRRFMLAAGYLSAGGIQVALGAWLGSVLGRLIDRKLGVTGPIGFGVGLAFAGFIGGVYQMWRAIQLLQRRQDAEKRDHKR